MEAILFQISKEALFFKLLQNLADCIDMRLARIFAINKNVVQLHYDKDI